MKLRIIVSIVALAGGIAFAQSGNRVLQDRYVIGPIRGDLIGNCADYGVGNFEVWNDWEASVHDVILFEKDGVTPKQLVENLKVLWEFYYNSTNPEAKRLTGGPGENQQLVMTYENGRVVSLRYSGPVFRVNVPGYGQVFAETGVFKREYYDGAWHFIMNSGKNQYWDGDIEALCWALK